MGINSANSKIKTGSTLIDLRTSRRRGESECKLRVAEEVSDEQTELIKSVMIPMLGMWGKGADLEAVAAELNSRLGPRAKSDEVWTAHKVQSFLTSAHRRVKREGTRSAPGTVYLEDDDYWVIKRPSGGYEALAGIEPLSGSRERG
jgi:hypothetical protein